MEKKGVLTARMLSEERSEILEEWMKAQLEGGMVREDLLSMEALRKQSEEFQQLFSNNHGRGVRSSDTTP